MLEYYKVIEKWPKNGQFFIHPQLVIDGSKVDINLDVDYMSFMEQPLLKDARNKLAGQKQELLFVHDEIYKDLTRRVAETLKILGVESLGQEKFTIHELQAVFSATITAICDMWMEFDPFIGNGFTLQEFVALWKGFLKDGLKGDVIVDDVIDTIVFAVREKYPGWAYTIGELEEIEQQKMVNRATGMVKKGAFDKMKGTTFYSLGY